MNFAGKTWSRFVVFVQRERTKTVRKKTCVREAFSFQFQYRKENISQSISVCSSSWRLDETGRKILKKLKSKFWGDYYKINSETRVASKHCESTKNHCSPVDRDSAWKKLFVSRYVKVFRSSTLNRFLHFDENGLSVFSPKVLFIDSLTEILWRYYCKQWCEKLVTFKCKSILCKNGQKPVRKWSLKKPMNFYVKSPELSFLFIAIFTVDASVT